ncbi:unnamed protein product [Eruca vesicaria subsp. sativa]|uniref:Transmembrane protein n=1 Tax=Eruca vesicaria subsp. sativa TaxID=29727 RepID=A0ABC8INV1_ERUVS|nr:unnamed protein product [Eruca vesicaria subsp. sativa]
MTSSIVSCMLLFLLLLVFPHMDKSLGSETELHKLKETNHPDEVTVQMQSRYFVGRPLTPCHIYQRCKRTPPTPTSSKGKYGSGH